MARPQTVCLHYNAEPIPAGESLVRQHRSDHVERQVQAVGFLGIDVEAHIGAARHQRQRQHSLNEFRHHSVALGRLVAGMQRRQLDRYARIVAHIAPRRTLGEDCNRLCIGGTIAFGVSLGASALSEHVVGVCEALLLLLSGVPDRLLDVASQHKLVAQNFHSLDHR